MSIENNDELLSQLDWIDKMSFKDLMVFATKVDPQLTKDILEDNNVSVFTRDEVWNHFDDCLNDTQEAVQVAGCSWAPADVLKTMDETAYNEGVRQYIDDRYTYLNDDLDQRLSGTGIDWYVDKEEMQAFYGDVEPETLAEDILERRPDLQAVKDARQLDMQTTTASNTWAPADLSGDHLMPQGQEQQLRAQRQARRL